MKGEGRARDNNLFIPLFFSFVSRTTIISLFHFFIFSFFVNIIVYFMSLKKGTEPGTTSAFKTSDPAWRAHVKSTLRVFTFNCIYKKNLGGRAISSVFVTAEPHDRRSPPISLSLLHLFLFSLLFLFLPSFSDALSRNCNDVIYIIGIIN